MIIAIDFDGTIATGPYPECGELLPGCKETLEYLHSQGHTLILNTCRVDVPLIIAKHFLYMNRLYHLFAYANMNTKELIEFYGTDTRKISADMYIDDKNFGGFPGWDVIRKHFEECAKVCRKCKQDGVTKVCKSKDRTCDYFKYSFTK